MDSKRTLAQNGGEDLLEFLIASLIVLRAEVLEMGLLD